jgi:Uma2 family endonuclease
MASSIIFEEQIEIPLDVGTLAEFRRWALSDEFPQRGRIDFVQGRIEVDMSPEDIFSHGTLKTEILGELHYRVKRQALGVLLTDSTRISSPQANLSAEPDIVFVTSDSIRDGDVRLVRKSTGEQGRYVEIEGGPNLVVEVVSDSSVTKDTKRLPQAYFDAGVREFWLADARGALLVFQIHRRGATSFEPVAADEHGFQPSQVFGCGFRLDRRRDEDGHWQYDLVASDAAA